MSYFLSLYSSKENTEKTRKYKIFSLINLFFVSYSFSFCYFSLCHLSICYAQQQTKVGVLLSLTGELAPIGVEIQRGMRQAYSELENPEFELLYEDDKSLNKASIVNTASRLINLNKVDLILNEPINTTKSIAPILNRNNVPGIVIWDNSRKICKTFKNIYCFGFSTETAGEDMAEYLFVHKSTKKVAVFSAIDDWSAQISNAFLEKSKSLGMEIVLNESFSPEEVDYRVQLIKAISKGVDAIYAPLFPSTISSFIKQARELGFKGIISTGDGFNSDNIKELGGLSEGILSTQVWSADSELGLKYQKLTGEINNHVSQGFFGLGYDAIRLVFELTKKLKASGEEINKISIAKELSSIEFTGATGKFSGKSNVEKEEPVTVVKNGELTELK